MALGNRGMTGEAKGRPRGGSVEALYERSERVESPGTYIAEIIMLGRVFFRTALPCSCGYHLERAGMSSHNAVGINCKLKSALNTKEHMSSKWAKGCMLMIMCVLCDLT